MNGRVICITFILDRKSNIYLCVCVCRISIYLRMYHRWFYFALLYMGLYELLRNLFFIDFSISMTMEYFVSLIYWLDCWWFVFTISIVMCCLWIVFYRCHSMKDQFIFIVFHFFFQLIEDSRIEFVDQFLSFFLVNLCLFNWISIL